MQSKATKILLLLLAVLLIANLAWVAFFVNSCRGPKQKYSGKDRFKKEMLQKLKEDVSFTDIQLKKYKEYTAAHDTNVEPLFGKLKEYKKSYFSNLSGSTSTAVVDSTLNGILAAQKEVYIKTLEHINRVRTICTQAQVPKYDSLVKKYAESKNHK